MIQSTENIGLRVSQFLRRPRVVDFSIERVFSDVRAALPPDIEVRPVVSRYFSKGVLSRFRGAWEARLHAADVNHVTGDVNYLVYFLPKRRTILTIHDCVFIEREHGVRRFLYWLFWLWLAEKRCVKIVAISNETKRRILAQIKCDPDKIIVIHNPVSDAFRPIEKTFNADRPRVLHIGTKANKNLERLIEALAGLKITLVVVGLLTAEQSQRLDRSGLVFENKTQLSADDLRAEYAAADIVAFVSTDEGFGLPIVEAQAVGRPVLTSRRAPMSEVAGNGAVLVNPEDINEIRTGLLSLVEDPGVRARVIAEGFRNVERFRARNVAAAYASAYRSVAIEASGEMQDTNRNS